MIRRLSCILFLMACVACSKSTFTPDRDKEEPLAPEVEAALADASARVEWPTGSLCYGDGGVIFGRSGAVLFAVDITTGQRVDLDTTAGTLIIDNATIDIIDLKCAQQSNGISWYTATAVAPFKGQIIFVTTY